MYKKRPLEGFVVTHSLSSLLKLPHPLISSSTTISMVQIKRFAVERVSDLNSLNVPRPFILNCFISLSSVDG